VGQGDRSGGGLAGAAEEDDPTDEHDCGDGEEREVVGEVVGGVGADLVEGEELVLDGAVVEVEAAGAEEDAGEGEAGWSGEVRRRSTSWTTPMTSRVVLKRWKRPSETRPAVGVERS
jgi:hypothetical protein